MKNYLKPEMDIYELRLSNNILATASIENLDGDTTENDATDDPLGDL